MYHDIISNNVSILCGMHNVDDIGSNNVGTLLRGS